MSSFLPTLKPGRSGVTMNARDAARSRAIARRVGARHGEDHVGVCRCDYPRLGAVQDASDRRRARPACGARPRRPGLGLRQREGAQHLAARHRLEVALLLLPRCRSAGASAWAASCARSSSPPPTHRPRRSPRARADRCRCRGRVRRTARESASRESRTRRACRTTLRSKKPSRSHAAVRRELGVRELARGLLDRALLFGEGDESPGHVRPMQ